MDRPSDIELVRRLRLHTKNPADFSWRDRANTRLEAADAIEALTAALEGMVMEWDQLTRYGSPMAKAANTRVAAARAALRKVRP